MKTLSSDKKYEKYLLENIEEGKHVTQFSIIFTHFYNRKGQWISLEEILNWRIANYRAVISDINKLKEKTGFMIINEKKWAKTEEIKELSRRRGIRKQVHSRYRMLEYEPELETKGKWGSWFIRIREKILG